jgi:hypothetical protein
MSSLPSSTTAESTVLLDNSTYFSFKRLVGAGELDADSVYNAATFLECLLTADRVLLAPTLAWAPSSEDGLFEADGPCEQWAAQDLSNATLSAVFRRALDSAQQDVSDATMFQTLGISGSTARKAAVILRKWYPAAEENPRRFLEVYSGAVLRTDSASGAFLSQIPTSVSKDAPAERHLAQYLLRTSTALELTGFGDREIFPYHPHSHRAAYVMRKLASHRRRAVSLGSLLIREAEKTEVQTARALRESSLLSEYGAFATIGNDTPLVLAVTLSGATSPAEILPLALKLRRTKEARRYRKWVREMITAVRAGDFDKQRRVHAEVEHAKNILSDELQKLYGSKRTNVVGAASALADTVDFEGLADLNTRKLLLHGAKEFTGKSQRITQFLERSFVKRKMALVIKLVRQREPEKQLSVLLKRVFRKGLSAVDVHRFASMRSAVSESVNDFNKSRREHSVTR